MRRFTFAMCLGVTLCAPVLATAQDTSPRFTLELNKIEDTDTGECRVVFFAQNALGADLQEMTLRLVLVDATGTFLNMIALAYGGLIDTKRDFRPFVIPTACSDISEIVVNSVPVCQLAGSEEQSDMCLTHMNASSRTAIALGI